MAEAPGDTIYALSTAPGRAAIAVIRLSGPGAGAALEALTGRPPPPARRATRAFLKDRGGAVLDEALVLWYPAPRSFTGENMAELHCHGGRAVIGGVLDALAALPGLALAGPGDFTRRAFENGKLDLAQAEGLADLIAAETDAQKRQALRQRAGALTRRVESWRADLIRLMALTEAEIDFPDEDLPEGLTARVGAEGRALLEAIDTELRGARRGLALREGYRVALLGAPNAGKSSLLNALAAREVAIVTDEPGTTRDVLEVPLDLGGYAVIVADMAGLRAAEGRVEALGIARAQRWAETADLRLALAPPGERLPEAVRALMQPGDLILRSKADLGGEAPGLGEREPDLAVSALTGAGLDALLESIAARVVETLGPAEPPVVTRLRHREALEQCRAALARALAGAKRPELRAEDFRLAARALGRITGRVDIEEVLDVIFGAFCIGK